MSQLMGLLTFPVEIPTQLDRQSAIAAESFRASDDTASGSGSATATGSDLVPLVLRRRRQGQGQGRPRPRRHSWAFIMSYPPQAQSQSQSSLGGGDSSVPHPFDVDQQQHPYSNETPIANAGTTNANTSRKGSIGAQTHKSSLQVGSTPSDGIYAPPPYPLPPVPSSSSSIPMSSSSTGRARAHSRSQVSQAGSTSLSLSLSASASAAIISEQKIQPGAELVEIHDRKHHQIPDAPYPLYYESISTDLCVDFLYPHLYSL
jgi:hypothetical protein